MYSTNDRMYVAVNFRQDAGHGRRMLVIRRAPSGFVRQMRVLIAEEAFLWGLTAQVTDYYGGGKKVVHGPWQAGDCRRVLLRWFDSGLVDCIAAAWGTAKGSGEIVRCEYDASWRSRAAERGRFLILDREDARALLSDPAAWDRDGAGAGVMLCESDAAEGLLPDDWLDALAGLPEDLIYQE
jgi:hypothetical protein